MSRRARDLRDWIDLLREAGELVEVTAEVDPNLEITEITHRTVRAGGPALLFTNVRGSDMPVLMNQFGSDRRLALAFGVENISEIADRISTLIELQPPAGLVDKVRTLGKLRSLASLPPNIVRSGPCQEVVFEGEAASLDILPILTCWPMDAGPFITLPLVFTADPKTGSRNCGMYRLQKFDARTTGLHWQIHKDAAADWRGMGERMDVAIALGTDPITTYAASAPLPKHIDEMLFAGFLQGESVDMVQCRTVDIQVPARSEIVIEGFVTRGELRTEGPFGDHTGYYSLADEYPVLHVTAVTHRRDAIYPSIIVGVPPQEDCWLGHATERIFLPLVQTTMPEIIDYALPWEGVFHGCAIVSISKKFPGHARKVMNAIWGTGLLSLTKTVIVVDEGVDVHDYSQVAFRAFANVDPARDIVLGEGPLDVLDHAPNLMGFGGKLGIDATATWTSEGYAREWPPDIVMDPDIVEQVTTRWPELGIPSTSA